MQSYWGIEHGDSISKAAKKDKRGPSAGRIGTAIGTNALVFPGLHGAVAGKKGKKLKAFGTEFGSQLAGGAAGWGLYAGTRGRATSWAPVAGGAAGTAYGVNRAQKKGYLQPDRGARFR